MIRRKFVGSLCSIGAVSAIVAGTLIGVAAPAHASVSDATLRPTVWNPGSTQTATVQWTESTSVAAGDSSFFSIEIEWDWSVAGTFVSGRENATYASNTFTCPSTGITFSSPNLSAAGAGALNVDNPECVYVNSGPGNQKKVTLKKNTAGNTKNFVFTGGGTVTATFPAPLITASTTPKSNYRWTLCSIDCTVGNYAYLYAEVPAEPVQAAAPTYPSQPPRNVTVTKVYDSALEYDVLKVTWEKPADEGTFPVTHYSVYGGPDWGIPSNEVKNATCATGPGLWTNPGNTDLNSCVVRSKNAGVSPQLGANVFFVKAFNGVGWSDAAQSNTLMVEYDATPPPAPTDVVAVGGWNKVTISWKKPAKAGPGGAITNYLAVSNPGRKVCITTALSYDPNRKTDANALSCEFTNLTPGTKYTFQAQALNGNGWGTLSVASNAAAPQNLKVTKYNRKKLGLFSLFKSEVTVEGASPGFPAGTVVTPWVAVGNGAWAAQPTFKTASTERFTWSRKFDRNQDGKAIKVKFMIAENASNQVVIPKVK